MTNSIQPYMTEQKAIEILVAHVDNYGWPDDLNLRNAIKLAISALQFKQRQKGIRYDKSNIAGQ